MNTNLPISSTSPYTSPAVRNTPFRRVSLTAGLLYVLTFISIPTLVLYGPAHEPNFITGSGSDNNILIGGLLEIIVALQALLQLLFSIPC